MKKGKRFEQLTTRIFQQLVENPDYGSVEHDVLLDGKDERRQIDVLITSKIAGITNRTIIECKDYSRKVGIGVIDSLHSVMQDVNANKGVVVSSNGFSTQAVKKAKRLGISLFTAHEALSEKWAINIEVPVLVTDITSVLARPRITIYLTEGTQFDKRAKFTINDIDPVEKFHDFWNNNTGELKDLITRNDFVYTPDNIIKPFFTRDAHGRKINVEEFKLLVRLEKNYYLGYLDKQQDSLMLSDILEDKMTLIFKSDCFLNYEDRFVKIPEREIPKFDALKINCLIKPVIENNIRVYREIKVTKLENYP